FPRDVLLEAPVGLDRGKRKIAVRGTLQLAKNPTCFRVTPEGDIFDSKPEIGDLVSRIVLVDVFEGVRSFVMPIQLRQQRHIIKRRAQVRGVLLDVLPEQHGRLFKPLLLIKTVRLEPGGVTASDLRPGCRCACHQQHHRCQIEKGLPHQFASLNSKSSQSPAPVRWNVLSPDVTTGSRFSTSSLPVRSYALDRTAMFRSLIVRRALPVSNRASGSSTQLSKSARSRNGT